MHYTHQLSEALHSFAQIERLWAQVHTDFHLVENNSISHRLIPGLNTWLPGAGQAAMNAV